VTDNSPRTLALRPTRLRSQRDINLWRIPLQLSLAATALFGITLIPDILDKYGVIHIPSWLTMGSIDDARAILSAMMGAVAPAPCCTGSCRTGSPSSRLACSWPLSYTSASFFWSRIRIRNLPSSHKSP
jgi:hypothetical protein